ncbi:MAG: agmatine deiminase [Caldilineaceae bacterium]
MTYYYPSIFEESSLYSFPAEDGFHMPAEWERHARCWMLWPEREDVWRREAEPAQAAFVEVAEAISRFEPVVMGVKPQHWERARRMLPDEVKLVEMLYDDAWMRDVGPTFVINQDGDVRGIDWEFNAWGGLYQDFSQDQRVARQVLDQIETPRYTAELVMEGGALHVDGDGTLLVVAENLLNDNRNPQLSRTDIEGTLCEYLNVEKVIWLPYGVFEDETDGHIDNLCCFVRPGVVALTWTDDPGDPQFARSHLAYEALSQTTDARGRRLEIHKIHQPGPLYLSHEEAFGVVPRGGTYPRMAGQRLAGSYINYYVANGGVIVPVFDDPYDEAALETIQSLYPDREVVGVSAREILLGGGNIHCITQQQPAGAYDR